MKYQQDIEKYIPSCVQEEKEKKIILDLINEKKQDILSRKSQVAHITSSGFTMNKEMNKILMVYHNIYRSWSWIGGHADGEEDLLEVACREAKEETGIEYVKPYNENIISIDILTTSGHVKNGEYVPAHLHLNISYLLIADENQPIRIKKDENSGVRWISVNEIEDYVTEKEMLKVYHKILNRLPV